MTFRLNNKTWQVIEVPAKSPHLRKSNGDFALGVCNDKEKTIYIITGLNDYMYKKVLCHEVTHAAMFSYNVNLTIGQEELLAELIATYGEEIIDVTERIFTKIKSRGY